MKAPGRKLHKRLRQFEHEPPAAREDLRHEAQALQRVAVALLGVQQDGLAVERLALPRRLLEVARRHDLEPPAPLEFGEAVEIVAAQQSQHRGAHVAFHIVVPDAERAAVAVGGLVEPEQRLLRMRHVSPGFVIIGLEVERAAERIDRIRRAAQFRKGRADRVVGRRILGIEGDRAARRVERLVETAVAVEHDGEVAQKKRRGRLERDRLAHQVDRFVLVVEGVPGEREHVPGAGVRRIDVERAPQRRLAFHVALGLMVLVGRGDQRDIFGAPRAVRHLRRAGDPLGKGLAHGGDHALPVAVPRLSEQPHGRVPGAVAAREQPAPVGRERQKGPHRLVERAREVNERRVGGNYQIEIGDGRGGFPEVGQLA